MHCSALTDTRCMAQQRWVRLAFMRWFGCLHVYTHVICLALQVNQQECKGQELSTDKKRQILADILVWAEISQSHYDQNTVS